MILLTGAFPFVGYSQYLQLTSFTRQRRDRMVSSFRTMLLTTALFCPGFVSPPMFWLLTFAPVEVKNTWWNPLAPSLIFRFTLASVHILISQPHISSHSRNASPADLPRLSTYLALIRSCLPPFHYSYCSELLLCSYRGLTLTTLSLFTLIYHSSWSWLYTSGDSHSPLTNALILYLQHACYFASSAHLLYCSFLVLSWWIHASFTHCLFAVPAPILYITPVPSFRLFFAFGARFGTPFLRHCLGDMHGFNPAILALISFPLTHFCCSNYVFFCQFAF